MIWKKLVSINSNNRLIHPINKMYCKIMRHTWWEQKQKAIVRFSPVKRGVLEMKNIHSWRCHRSLQHSPVTNNLWVGSNLMGSKIQFAANKTQNPNQYIHYMLFYKSFTNTLTVLLLIQLNFKGIVNLNISNSTS